MTLFFVGLGLCLVGAFGACVMPTRGRLFVAMIFGAAGSVCAAIAALEVMSNGRPLTFHSSMILPLTGVDFALDPLGAVFVLATAAVGLSACLYSVGYATAALRTRSAVSLFLLFLFSLIAVPAASSIATLLALWELMALSSMLLIVVGHSQRREARDAAQWYGVMTQLGASSILLGLLLLTVHGSGQTFAEIARHASTLSPVVKSGAFVLVLIGFASKAGAVPLHVWLPKAHPEAPSPVSALMSGSMVALGVYGIVRVGGDLLGGGPLWWWVVVAALGVVSALFGALHATSSSDLKALLAYSTIDLLGLVLVGVGAAGALVATGHRDVGQLAMVASLMLVLAHAAFKGCLFLATGAVERASGTRDLDQLGGLIHKMPATTAIFAVGALSIIAVPTLSGFSSEWLLLQGLLHGFVDRSSATLIVLLVGVVALALTGGLTAVAFVKAFGIGFLGRPRSPRADSAHEVSKWMVMSSALLVVPCLVLGVAPGVMTAMLARAANSALGTPSPRPVGPGLGLVLSGLDGALEPMLLLGALASALVAAWVISAALGRRATRRVEAWGCGREFQTSRMQYTATSFGEPLQRVFADVLRPDVDLEVTHVSESRYYEQSLSYRNRVEDAVERSLYLPVVRVVQRFGLFARRLQNGNIHRYLAFGFVALLTILVVLS